MSTINVCCLTRNVGQEQGMRWRILSSLLLPMEWVNPVLFFHSEHHSGFCRTPPTIWFLPSPFLCFISQLGSHRCRCSPLGAGLQANVYAKPPQYTCVHKPFLLPKGLFAYEKPRERTHFTLPPQNTRLQLEAGSGNPPHKASSFHCQLTNSLFQRLLRREISPKYLTSCCTQSWILSFTKYVFITSFLARKTM